MAIASKLITAEEFHQLGLSYAELVEGEIVEYMPLTPEHGEIAASLVSLLKVWLKKSKTGRVGTDGGFILGRNPDVVRGPDVWFVGNEWIPQDTSKFWEVAPSLVAEIVSPSDTATVIKEKLNDYFKAGTELIWLVYPEGREVEVRKPDGTMITLKSEDLLECEILPHFSCKVAELFE